MNSDRQAQQCDKALTVGHCVVVQIVWNASSGNDALASAVYGPTSCFQSLKEDRRIVTSGGVKVISSSVLQDAHMTARLLVLPVLVSRAR